MADRISISLTRSAHDHAEAIGVKAALLALPLGDAVQVGDHIQIAPGREGCFAVLARHWICRGEGAPVLELVLDWPLR